MTSHDFCYWLQGYLEISEAVAADTRSFAEVTLNKGQMDCVRKHLAMVFKHEIDPSAGPEEHQNALNHLHNQIPGSDVKIRC